jgi:hypothetical protein
VALSKLTAHYANCCTTTTTTTTLPLYCYNVSVTEGTTVQGCTYDYVNTYGELITGNFVDYGQTIQVCAVLDSIVFNPACDSGDGTVGVVEPCTPVTPSNAGVSLIGGETCGITTVTLDGNNPIVGTGMWSVVSGTGGSFDDPSVYNTNFTGVAGETYVLAWTISDGPCNSSTSTMTVIFFIEPTIANAGPSYLPPDTCGLNTVTLFANTPTVGTGQWTIISGIGGVIADDTDPNTDFTGVDNEVYDLRWTITNPPCAPSVSSIIVDFTRGDCP